MTAPTGGGGNEINLAALWVPVMPETSKMGPEMRKAGEESKKQFEQGFNSGSSPEDMGGSFGKKLQESIKKGMEGFELPLGMSGALEKLGGDIDEKLVKKLKGEASDALRAYTAEYDKLTEATARQQAATDKLNLARDNGFNKASITLPLLSAETKARNEVEAQTTKTSAAYENLTGKSDKLTEATKGAAGGGEFMAGIMGGLVVAGLQAVSGAVDALAEKMIEGVVETFKTGIEVTKEFAERMIEVGEDYENMGIQIHEFSNATGEAFESLEESSQKVFSSLDVAGKNTGQVMAQLTSALGAPAEELETLGTHVLELQGRFSNLKATDVASIFVAFKTPAEETDAALASLQRSAAGAGQSLGDLTSGLSGDAALTLAQAGLSIQQAGAFMADLMKMGAGGRNVMTGLQTAMKEFGKEGLSFGDGMQLAGQRLKELGDTAEGQDLAEKLFGTRRWATAMTAVQDYVDVVNTAPGAFDSNTASLDNFISSTETLENKWETVKHAAEDAFKPMGQAALGLASSGLDWLVKQVNSHMDQIKRGVQVGGVAIIGIARDLEDFAGGVLRFFAPISDALVTFFSMVINAAGTFAFNLGTILELVPGMGKTADGLKQAGNAAVDMAHHLNDLKVGDGMNNIADWLDKHKINVQETTDKWTEYWNEASGQNAPASIGSAIGSQAGAFGTGGAAPMPPVGGGGAGSLPGFTAGPTGAAAPEPDQKSAATAIFNAVKGMGYSENTALTAVAAALYESSLDSGVTNASGHHGLFQESKDKPSGSASEQIAWFLGALKAAGGPGVVDADPANIIADKVEIGGYSGSNYDVAAAKKMLGYAAGGPSRMVTSGSGMGDDVPALLGKGEYVWDSETVDKYGWLIEALHQGSVMGFDQGGSTLDTKGAQVDTIAVAEAAQKLFGINDIGMYRAADGYNEHASGEAADVMVGNNKSTGDQIAQYFLQNAAQFGVQYVLWQQTQWNPDGSSSKMQDRGGATANHMDHVHVRTEGGGFPQGADQSGFASPSTGKTSNTAAPVAMGMGIGGAGSIPAGANGASFPGMPGQYGGGGVYGGQTADQAASAAKAVREANDRKADLDTQVANEQKKIDDLKKQIADVGNDPSKMGILTGKPLPKTPAEQAADDDKRKSLQDQLDSATQQLAKSQREQGEAGDDITDAMRKQQESALKKPSGSSQQTKAFPGAAQLGQGLLQGIGEELGVGDIFSKSPLDWGIVKLLGGLAGWGVGEANGWADMIGAGKTGMTGFQALPGFDQSAGGGGGGGALGGILGGVTQSLGVTIPSKMMSGDNVSAGPNITAQQPLPFGAQGTGPAPGPVVQGDYMPINVQAGVDPGQILAPVQEQQNKQNAGTFSASGGFPAS